MITFNKNGIVGGVNDSPITYEMKFKTLSDGSTWARIHWLDVTNIKSWFKNADEIQFCNQVNKYSRMGIVEQFKSIDNYYEFMLTYPSLSSTWYNRWKQTSSPNNTTVTGFKKNNYVLGYCLCWWIKKK